VGANIGLYTLWAQQEYRPQAIYSYEASPKTFSYLRDNVSRLINRKVTTVTAFNRAIASTAGQKLVLHQSTNVSGISTLLDRSKVRWIETASAGDQLETHEVITSTVSTEIEANQLAVVDILKIDVEGYFLEVFNGIAPKDFPKIRNIVAEIDYLPETGIAPDAFEKLLKEKGYKTDCFDRSQQNNLTFYAWRE
jgi:FkbM family methyltransferase